MGQMKQERVDAITQALESMNHSNVEEWNEDGTPKLSIVRGYAQDPTITEAEIKFIDPAYRRQEPTKYELRQAEDDEGNDAADGEADPPKQRPDGVEVIDFAKVSPDRVAELLAYKPELQRLIDEQAAIRDGAINRLQTLNYEMDELVSAIAFHNRPVGHTNEVRRFLASQNEQRAREAKNREQIGAALGIKLPAHATALDTAMAQGYSPHGGSKRRAPIGPCITGSTLDLGRIDMRVGAGAGVR